MEQLLNYSLNNMLMSASNGMTPLMIASFNGHTDVVQTLIEAKAQINTQDEDGWTALHLAAQEGKVDVVRLLTEAQALVNIQNKV
ncbi:CARD- and ANK-domain containing inflammasome adapter protein [Geodia barretti]|uniref:CARD- and ANK-domain containing inflammasome adapter protein n=1 Tax=Geodia barretti TaxID=519541 RepID=A0AA35TEV7_GEOBA|nr:CARD- and ANK-domain containing inflammasome adapter protein [Geodia barretti]